MTKREYKDIIKEINGEKHKLSGRRIIIKYTTTKRNYECIIDKYGTIIKTNSGSTFGIKVDDCYNKASSTGLYWIDYGCFDLLKEERENIKMKKLTGYKKVAVIKQSGKDYLFAIYDDGFYYKPGDKIIVSGDSTIKIIDDIITSEDANNRFGKNITSEVITKLDTFAYDERVNKREEIVKLKAKIDKEIKEMDEINKYEMYAKQNPYLQELLNKLKELTE